MINEGLLDDSQRELSLEACALRRGVTPKLGAELKRELARFDRKGARNVMQHFHKLPGDHPLVIEYAEGDGRTTLALWHAQQPLLEGQRLGRVHRLECDLIPHLAALRRRGIRVDAEYGAEAIREVRREAERLRLHFPKDFNPSKRGMVAAWLKEQGVHDFPTTATGQESTAKGFLETIEPGRRIIALREIEKVENAFIVPLLSEHQRNGRIHPELVQGKTAWDKGTHTGRFSCVDPNLQQYPKRNATLGKLVRPLIVPDEDMVIAESDISQQEPRLYAHYAKEEALIEGYNATPYVDIHTTTAELMGIPRDTAKTVGLSIFNGMQSQSLSERLRCTVVEAQDYINRFFQAYPAIKAFVERAPRAAYRNGHVRTVLGRICHLEDHETRMAVSRVIQGSGADQLKMLLLRACEYAQAHPQIEVLMSIHDSLLWQARKGTDTREFQRVLEDNSEFYQIYGEERIPMRVPFPLETRVGRNWAEASYK